MNKSLWEALHDSLILHSYFFWLLAGLYILIPETLLTHNRLLLDLSDNFAFSLIPFHWGNRELLCLMIL